MNWTDYDKAMAALTCWREARGEPREGQRAVLHVMRNRVQAGQGTWDHVITKKWQFSSMTAPADPELVLWPAQPDAAFDQIMLLVEGVFDGSDTDITGGALFYFNPKVVMPSWAATMKKTGQIGNHDFYRPAGLWSSQGATR
jgi:N-acetylmuramoyl-L-alanine amidase